MIAEHAKLHDLEGNVWCYNSCNKKKKKKLFAFHRGWERRKRDEKINIIIRKLLVESREWKIVCYNEVNFASDEWSQRGWVEEKRKKKLDQSQRGEK